MVQLTGDIIVAIVAGAVGFTGWLIKVSMDLGRIRGILETRLQGVEKRVQEQEGTVDNLRDRIIKVEVAVDQS